MQGIRSHILPTAFSRRPIRNSSLIEVNMHPILERALVVHQVRDDQGEVVDCNERESACTCNSDFSGICVQDLFRRFEGARPACNGAEAIGKSRRACFRENHTGAVLADGSDRRSCRDLPMCEGVLARRSVRARVLLLFPYQHHTFRFHTLTEAFRDLVPDEQVHPER